MSAQKQHRKPWVIAEELDRYVERHERVLEESSAYKEWVNKQLLDGKISQAESREAMSDWYNTDRHREIIDTSEGLKKELQESLAAHNAEEIRAGRKRHALETMADDKFPEELIYLDSSLSDPAHFFSVADKERALINRVKNDELARARDEKTRARRRGRH